MSIIRILCVCFLMCITTASVLVASCPPQTAEPTVTLGPAKPVSQTLNINTQPNKIWIPLTVTFHDNKTKLVNVKASGGMEGYWGPGAWGILEHGTCSPYITGSNLGAEIGPYSGVGLIYTCEFVVQPQPSSVEKTQQGSAAVTFGYDMANIPIPSCTGNGFGRDTSFNVIYKSPQPAPVQEEPVVFPDVKLKLSNLSHDPVTAQVTDGQGGTSTEFYNVGTASTWDKTKFLIRTRISMEPYADATDFILDPGGLQAAGIGIAPQESTFITPFQLKLTFKPRVAKLYQMKLILTWKACLHSNLNKCGPEQSFIFPFQADSRPPFAGKVLKPITRDVIKVMPPSGLQKR